jgi:hypothetical protein
MKKQPAQVVFKLLVIIFAAAYVTGSYTNLLYIPRYAPDGIIVSRVANTPVHIETKDRQAAFLQLFDKSIFDNEILNAAVFAPRAIDLFFNNWPPPVTEAGIFPPQNHLVYNCQYSYLSFCTFRI